jgi:uncharacterized protein
MRTHLARLLLDKKEVKIRVIPNASVSEIKDFKEGVLQVRLNAVPDKGKANKELIKLFKKELNLNIKIIKGEKN